MTVCELLSDEECWIQEVSYASDWSSISDDPKEADCFCLAGAIDRCYSSTRDRERKYRKVAKVLRSEGWEFTAGISSDAEIARFNDAPTTTFVDIRRVIERAGI